MPGMARLKIMLNGREVLTAGQVAELAGIKTSGARMLIKRAGLRAVDEIGAVYDRAAIEAALESRPGRGAPGQPRAHRPPTAE
jgi:hypothetical protein